MADPVVELNNKSGSDDDIIEDLTRVIALMKSSCSLKKDLLHIMVDVLYRARWKLKQIKEISRTVWTESRGDKPESVCLTTHAIERFMAREMLRDRNAAILRLKHLAISGAHSRPVAITNIMIKHGFKDAQYRKIKNRVAVICDGKVVTYYRIERTGQFCPVQKQCGSVIGRLG